MIICNRSALVRLLADLNCKCSPKVNSKLCQNCQEAPLQDLSIENFCRQFSTSALELSVVTKELQLQLKTASEEKQEVDESVVVEDNLVSADDETAELFETAEIPDTKTPTHIEFSTRVVPIEHVDYSTSEDTVIETVSIDNLQRMKRMKR